MTEPSQNAPKKKKALKTGKWHVGDKIQRRFEVHDVKFGGMGVVYICFDHEFKKPVALKTLQDRYLTNTSLVARFMWEAETWVRLEKHKNIVQAYYVNMIDGMPFIFIEYILGNERFGPELKGWIQKGGLDLPASLNFAVQFCSGMIHAQEKFMKTGEPFVYRDVKPANVMVTKDRTVKITDFGLVKLTRGLEMAHVDKKSGKVEEVGDFTFTRAGTIMGTPFYMSPEQWRAEAIDMRADVYAFGCMLFEMITGKPPFVVKTLDELIQCHLNKKPESLTYIPRTINTLIQNCLEKDRADRTFDFHQIRDELLAVYNSITGRNMAIVESSSALEAWELVNKGVSLFNLKYFEEAVKCYNEAVRLRPGYAEAFLNRGIANRALGRSESAVADYEEAIRLKPDYTEAFYNRGVAFMSKGRIDEAIKDYNAALRLNPSYAEAYYNRGIAFRKRGDVDSAIADYTTAIGLRPDYVRAYYNRGNAFYSMSEIPQAIADFEKSISLRPNYAEAYYNLALCYEQDGDNAGALDAWENYVKTAKTQTAQKDWVGIAQQHIASLKDSIRKG